MDSPSPQVKDLVQAWDGYLHTRNFSEGTIRVYHSKLRKFLKYVEFRKADVLESDFRFIEGWELHERGEELTSKTIHNGRVAIACFFHWAKREGLIPSNPCIDLDPITIEESIPDFWSEEEVTRILSAPVSKRNRAVLETLYATGAREREVRGIDLQRLSLRERVAIVPVKGRKEWILHFNQSAAGAIEAWLPEREELLSKVGRHHETALFISRIGRKISYFPFRKIVVDAARAAGLEGPAHPHMLRHSFATHMLDRGMRLEELKELMGHKEIRSTLVYTHIARAKLRETYDRFHPRR